MSTYLQLCNSVGTKLGIQGTILSVTNPIGLQKIIVDAVKDAWVDIQRYRDDWTFMIGTNSNFSTVAGQTDYTTEEVFGTALAAEDLSTYKQRRGIFLDNRPLTHIPFEDLPFQANDRQVRPRWFSYRPLDNLLIFEMPDDSYDLVIRYNRSIQTFAANADEPVLPQTYQNVIVYRAVADVAADIGDSNRSNKYERKYNYAIGELMRTYITRRRINTQGIA